MAVQVVKARISFSTIWNNYPREPPCINPRTKDPPHGFENQCAIKVGLALERSGVSFHSLSGGRCPTASSMGGMVASAQTLATGYARNRSRNSVLR